MGVIGGSIQRRGLLHATALLGVAAGLPASLWAAEGALDDQLAGDLTPVHDPCIIKQDDTYHLFCTGQAHDPTGLLPWRTFKDLINWTLNGRVFDSIPQWARDAVPGTRGVWAPDIAYFNGLYHLYYSCSTFGSNHSVIGLVSVIHDEESGAVTILALNRSTSDEMQLDVELRGLGEARKVSLATELHHGDLKAINSKAAPDTVAPKNRTDVSIAKGVVSARLKPLSWNVIVTTPA